MADEIVPSASFPRSEQDRETEDRVFRTCTRAGVCCIGIQSGFGVTEGMVLFSKPCTTLAIPLSAFADPEQAIKTIKAKLDHSADFMQVLPGFPGTGAVQIKLNGPFSLLV